VFLYQKEGKNKTQLGRNSDLYAFDVTNPLKNISRSAPIEIICFDY